MPFPIPVDKIERRHYINGEFVESSDKGTFELKSPFSHDKIVDVCEATVDDTNRAVAAAKAAFPSWSSLGPYARGVYLKKLAALILPANAEFAQLDAMCMGRPIASNNSSYAAMIFDHYAEEAWTAHGTTSLNASGFVNMTFRQPIGPVAAIIPWNTPVLMFAMKAAPALAAGCTVVLKSSEKAPLSSAKIAALAHEAGFPPGVLNVLSGHGTPAGATLSAHMDIRLVNFTGSTQTGRKIQAAAAASNLKRVVLELGGKSPAIIFADADLERAAADTSASMHLINGQACIATSRIYVQAGPTADRFRAEFRKVFAAPRKGDPLSPDTQQGPQADAIQFERIKGYLRVAAEGAGKLALGGEATQVNGTGFFIEPTILHDVPEDERIQKEEIFGPVVTINTFETEAEVIKKANDTEYGLYASVYTNDLSRALRVAKAFEAGSVGVNCCAPSGGPDLPFGGYKGSGQGREGFGYSIDEYLEHKSVIVKLAVVDDAPK